MKYQGSLLAVKDIKVSKKIYKQLFEKEIKLNTDKNEKFKKQKTADQELGRT